ncbi:2,3-bisphosphoglycerate-independent phosphoglycerate mutase [Thermodesulfobacteriota bacterium]
MDLRLNRLSSFHGRQGPLLLIIMDGIGLGRQDESNALYLAKTPTLDRLLISQFFFKLQAHGRAVGLPSDKDMGNSEVGHNALGAGRVFNQGARLVNRAIETGRIYDTELWAQIIERAKNGGTVHFIGLLSDGNVHSHIDHLYSLLDKCAELGVERVRVHALMDGRDVGERSALEYVVPTEEKLRSLSEERGLDFAIASGGGRMRVTMDRYNADWDIVKRGWDAHVLGIGRFFKNATEALETYYREDPNITDQYMDAFVIADDAGNALGPIVKGDAVVFMNFRGDRAIEISRAFSEKEFREFERGPLPDILYAGMMEYDGDTHIPPNFLVTPPDIERTVSEYLCAAKIPMFAISETQKYGHVTYFWNGNRSGYINESFETYVEIPSDKIEFDRLPAMKAVEIKDKSIDLLKSGQYRFGRLNFANGDMVGHTGVMEAAVAAVETVDRCVGELLRTIEELKGVAVVTSDHGNADEMYTIDKDGRKKNRTAHTLNPVPFVIFDPEFKGEYAPAAVDSPGLSNVAATLLNLLGYEKVEDYDPSLINMKNGQIGA